MSDILNYEMTAFDQKVNFNQAQKELTDCYQNSTEFSIKLLLQLFPVISSNKRDMLKRTPLKFSQTDNYVFTDYDSSQMIAFGDEALGQVYMSLPAHLSAHVSYDSSTNKFTLTMIDVLEMQINRLVEMGLNRSAFQNVLSMTFQDSVILTCLQDTIDPNKITNLIVYLTTTTNRSNEHQTISAHNAALMSNFSMVSVNVTNVASSNDDSSSCCDGITGKTTWIVYVRNGDVTNTCLTTSVNCVSGANGEWTIKKSGFESQADADNWIATSGQCNTN